MNDEELSVKRTEVRENAPFIEMKNDGREIYLNQEILVLYILILRYFKDI